MSHLRGADVESQGRLQKFAAIPDEQRRTYAAAMFALDEAIGRVLAALRATDLLDDTLVVFMNDNGGPTMSGVTVNGAINLPLRGSKRTTPYCADLAQ